jgi:hypothetical protein
MPFLPHNLGGFAGPYAIGWIKDATGETTLGLVALAPGPIMAGVVTFLMGHDSKLEMAGSRTTAEGAETIVQEVQLRPLQLGTWAQCRPGVRRSSMSAPTSAFSSNRNAPRRELGVKGQ